jgi:hypothetical protein
LVARSATGAELTRVKVGEGAQLLAPIFDNRVVIMKTSTSPLALITLREDTLWLLGAVRPDGNLAGVSYQYHALPQWLYRVTGKAPDGAMLDLRGVGPALADPSYGMRLDGEFPPQPWVAAPEISRA